jgi:MSHA biogenesis protein MshL
MTRTYDLNYLNVQREGSSDSRVSSGQATVSDDTGTSSSGTTTSSSSSTVNASQLVTSSKVDFWSEVGEVVGALIGDEEGNKVVVNPQASLLVVRASSADQQNVEAFLKQAERNLQRQVVLEAKILEVRLSDSFQAGINWSRLGTTLNLDLSGNPLSGPAGVGGVFSALYSSGDFTALLQLLETQGQVRVLSSPRVSTLNNQKAVIKVGSDEFFVTDVSTTTTTLAGGTTAPDLDITLTPFFSGISLDVTPQINEREDVTLHVRPTISRVQDQEKTITLGSEDNKFTLPLALSNTRQSDSIVRARSGQVVVIGGLLENSIDNTDANVPWLSKLPFLGGLFQQQRKDVVRSELVILLRPQVIGADTWLEELQKSADSFRELR